MADQSTQDQPTSRCERRTSAHQTTAMNESLCARHQKPVYDVTSLSGIQRVQHTTVAQRTQRPHLHSSAFFHTARAPSATSRSLSRLACSAMPAQCCTAVASASTRCCQYVRVPPRVLVSCRVVHLSREMTGGLNMCISRVSCWANLFSPPVISTVCMQPCPGEQQETEASRRLLSEAQRAVVAHCTD